MRPVFCVMVAGLLMFGADGAHADCVYIGPPLNYDAGEVEAAIKREQEMAVIITRLSFASPTFASMVARPRSQASNSTRHSC